MMISPQIWQTKILAIVLGICLCFGFGTQSAVALPDGADLVTSRAPVAIAALTAASLDLEADVDHFLKSIPAGYYKIGQVTDLKTQLAATETTLIDVRQPSEYWAGHIPNAINLPLRTLTDHLDQIPRDRPVVLYCSTGYRSALGVAALHLLGYDNVQGFPPSFVAWQAAGETIAQP